VRYTREMYVCNMCTADGQLQVAGGDALDFQVLGGVAGQLEHLCVYVFVSVYIRAKQAESTKIICRGRRRAMIHSVCVYVYLGTEVLQDGGGVHSGGGTHAVVGLCV
jgi:hypothetical protein